MGSGRIISEVLVHQLDSDTVQVGDMELTFGTMAGATTIALTAGIPLITLGAHLLATILFILHLLTIIMEAISLMVTI